MERLILKKLLDWKNSPYRKPLILKGGASGWKNMDFTRIWQTLLGHMKGILQSILMSVSFQRFR